jgi:hypothetical protein
MWEPQRLTTLWASTACYKDSFTFTTAVVMKSSNFWDIMLCGSVKVSKCFRRTYHLHLLGQRVSQTRIQHEAVPPITHLINIYMKVKLTTYLNKYHDIKTYGRMEV